MVCGAPIWADIDSNFQSTRIGNDLILVHQLTQANPANAFLTLYSDCNANGNSILVPNGYYSDSIAQHLMTSQCFLSQKQNDPIFRIPSSSVHVDWKTMTVRVNGFFNKCNNATMVSVFWGITGSNASLTPLGRLVMNRSLGPGWSDQSNVLCSGVKGGPSSPKSNSIFSKGGEITLLLFFIASLLINIGLIVRFVVFRRKMGYENISNL
jgi:hypothetical protein